jgi:ParB/Sulfiredoxin domain
MIGTWSCSLGFRQPIVVDTDGVVIVGHTRLLAAKQLGWRELPLHIAVSVVLLFRTHALRLLRREQTLQLQRPTASSLCITIAAQALDLEHRRFQRRLPYEPNLDSF